MTGLGIGLANQLFFGQAQAATITVPPPAPPVVVVVPTPPAAVPPVNTPIVVVTPDPTVAIPAAPTPTPRPAETPTAVGPVTTTEAIAASTRRLAFDRINQFFSTRNVGNILLGATEQVNSCSCVTAFGAFGSASGGAHGRYGVTDDLTILGGAAVFTHRDRGADVKVAPTFALSLRYDPAHLGPSRPFVEVGGVFTPAEALRYRRDYLIGGGVAAGAGNTTDSTYVGFVRAGYIARLSPQDEFAVSGEYARGWQNVRRYSEPASVANPFAASLLGGTDIVNISKFAAQYTRLLTPAVEANLSGGVGYAFDQRSGLVPFIAGAGFIPRTRLRDTAFFEGGGRLGFRVTESVVIDTFVVAIAGAQPVGTTFQGGVGVRYAF